MCPLVDKYTNLLKPRSVIGTQFMRALREQLVALQALKPQETYRITISVAKVGQAPKVVDYAIEFTLHARDSKEMLS